MSLTEGSLQTGSSGANVRWLHSALRRLGFSIDASERQSEFFGGSTLAAARQFQEENALPVGGVVDERTAALISDRLRTLLPPPRQLVHGTVRDAAGGPLADALVQAVDVDLKTQSVLGEIRTDRNGHYEIGYDARGRPADDADGPDLLVRLIKPGETPPSVDRPSAGERAPQ